MKLLKKEYFFQILPRINLMLVFSVIVLTIYLILSLLRPAGSFVLRKGCFMEEAKLIDEGASLRFAKTPVFQEGIFKKRSLFSPLIEKKPQPQDDATFKLLGLISVGGRNAAMIRDIKKKEDYYCLGGEVIGAFRVKRVLKDRVILESEGKTLEITR